MSESINSQHALDPGAFQPPVPEYLYDEIPRENSSMLIMAPRM